MNPQDSGFVVTLVINAVVAIIAFTIFCIFRMKMKTFYQTRCEVENGPPELPRTFLSWLIPFFKNMNFGEILKTHGTDAYMYLRFLRASLLMVTAIGVLGWIILFPINHSGHNKSLPSDDPLYCEGLATLSIANIPEESDLLWAHFVFTFVVTAIVTAILWWEYREYCRVRLLFKRIKIPSNYSIMIKALPKDVNTPAELENYVNKMAPVKGSVVDTQLFYTTEKLNKKIIAREEAVRKLEHAKAEFKKKGEEPVCKDGFLGLLGNKHPAIEFWSKRLEGKNTQIEELQKAVGGEMEPSAGVAFVSFSSQKSAQVMSEVVVSKNYPNESLVCEAPEPSDVNWEWLHISLHSHRVRTIIVNVGIFFLVFFWSVPVVFLSGFSNLETLSHIDGFSFLVDAVTTSSVITGFLQGFLPNLVLILFMALLTLIIRAIAGVQGIHSLTILDRSVMNKYFLFLICNVLLVFSIGGSVFTFLNDIIDDYTKLVSILANSLPIQATQFTNYIMIAGFGWYPLGLLRPGPLIVGAIKQKLLCLTEREHKEAVAPGIFEYPISYAKELLILCIALTYCTMNPFIMIFAVLFFAFALFANFYNIKYVNIPTYEGGGILWPSAFKRVLVGLLIYQLAMVGLLNLKRVPGASALAVQIAYTLIFWYLCEHNYARKCRYGVLDDEETEQVPNLKGAYAQPSLKPISSMIQVFDGKEDVEAQHEEKPESATASSDAVSPPKMDNYTNGAEPPTQPLEDHKSSSSSSSSSSSDSSDYEYKSSEESGQHVELKELKP